jgi:hypothetical protein
MPFLEVVYCDPVDEVVYRLRLDRERIKKDKQSKIYLPENVYSKGYYERMSDGDWSRLPDNSFKRIKFY